ncbi:Type 2 lactosamine alpha-2,3-sialyltransferase [Galemys pyrenaicus]|uniref:Type 2 lactosamine alpha-2,3-sialyltransferase n=1 Tax=Galemys pyrenaicus TaxID=202257 RepID=A0A8J6DHC0_GALPY|nr:Type 2 lactosamine alpha-2,3-sialyltransferase [Galemys pyrenaicus]
MPCFFFCPCVPGGPAMRAYLVAIFLSAVFLYYVLHCILWGTNVYWVPPVEMKRRNQIQPCLSKPAFASLLRFQQFHPFLCAADFKKIASLYGSDKFDLPYGIRTSAEYFRLALSKLQSCDLFDEFDKYVVRGSSLQGSRLHRGLWVARPQAVPSTQRNVLTSAGPVSGGTVPGATGPVLEYDQRICRGADNAVFEFFLEVILNYQWPHNSHKEHSASDQAAVTRKRITSWLMNNGPVLGHEEDVGRRTTFRLFYPESVFSDFSHNDPNTTVILTVFKPLDLKWLWELLTGGKININGFWKKPALNLIYKPYQIRILDPFIIRMAAYELLHFPKVFPKNQNAYHNVTAEQLFLKDIIEKNFVINLTQD